MSEENPRKTDDACSISCRCTRVARSPWSLGLLAVLELVLGFVLLGFPYMLGASATWVAGFVFIAVGILRMVTGLRRVHHRGWNLLAALLYLAVGLGMVFNPGAALAAWTLIIGLVLVVVGCLRFVLSLGMRGTPGSAWRFFSAIISLILGAMVTFGWPDSTLWFVGTLIAVEMIFSGWTLLFLALTPKEQ